MNNQELQADLAKVAAEYNHSVLQQAVLENYKDSILLLRAKYASYEKISELLNERDIKVSVATVRKFCRKYQDEAQRLRAEIAADSGTEDKSAPLPFVPATENRPPLTSEPGKRGPRTARDTL
jgi:transcription termination factor Rho